jgi:hypothetical protein
MTFRVVAMHVVAIAGAVFLAPPTAAAQTASDDIVPFVAGIAGAAAVHNGGGLAGGEIGVAISKRIEIFGEGLWMQDVVTGKRMSAADTVASYLQTTQGKPATGTVEAPASYAGGAVRIMLTTTGAARPYIAAGFGAAHVAYKPMFTLSGADITGSLPQYGVTLGSDITGETTEPAFTLTPGVRFGRGRWYVDGQVGLVSIRTSEEATNVLRVSGAFGVTF